MRDFGLATASALGAGTASADGTSQALPGLLERVRSIILTPKTQWQLIEAEPTSVSKLYSGFVMPMAAFAAVMSFFRMSVVGVTLPDGGALRMSLVSGLFSSLLTFVMGLVGLYLVGMIINMLASVFGGLRDRRQALKTAAYALTPAWLGTALTFLPLGSLLQLIAGLYGLYVLHLGLPVMMKAKQAGTGGYTAAVVACLIGVGILFGMIAATLGAAAGLH
jgi:Yip1 domain